MYQVIGMSVAGQFSGNGLAYFNTVIYGKLGVDTVSKQLEYNIGFQLVSAFGAFCGALLTDRMPRRKVLVIGTMGRSWLVKFLCYLDLRHRSVIAVVCNLSRSLT